MSLLNKFLPKGKDKEYFLTVAVEENRITATVSLITGSQVTIIGTGTSEFDDASEETEAADIAISEAEKKIGSDILVERVIFGLPLSLLEGDKIKPQYLERLKKITKTLSLTPAGFIEYPQALAYYLETKEESPPTLLLISIGKKLITISHIRVGKIEKSVIEEKTESIAADFEKALSSFVSSDILPSRIMLYDQSGEEKLADTSEELLKFPWHKHSTFLHTPKIETLEVSALSYALVESAARSLAKELQIDQKETLPVVIQQSKEKEQTEETFGFITGRDIMMETVQIDKEKPQDKQTVQEAEAKSDQEHLVDLKEKTVHFDIPAPQKESIFPKLPQFKISPPQFSFPKLPAVSLSVSAIILIILFFFIFWYYPKAAVNLIVYPSSSVANVDVLFATSADSAATGKNSILTSTVSEEVSGDKTASTTGKTNIGEKSSGTVTVYNKTLAGKNFPKGTVLTVDTLKFTLDDDVTIASASDTGEGLTFGKTNAKITSVNIGPEGNLASGTNFYFQSFDKSSYYAKNTDKLTGGTSREITSVSKDDQDKLLASLTEELTTQAKQKMMQKINPGDRLLDSSVTNSVTSKKFSQNIGEESKELSLSLTIKVIALTYKEEDLLNLTRDNTTQVPSGFTLAADKTNIKISETKTDKNGNVVGRAKITYYFFPQMDINTIKSNIAGKNFADIDKYLSTIKEIGGVEIIIDPKLPFVSDKLPFRKENIQTRLVSS